MVLAAERGRYERARVTRAGEHDVARLVADEQGPQHARRAIEAHHADRIRQMIHHPHFVGIALGHRHWFEPDRDAAGEAQRIAFHRVDLEAGGGRIDDVHALSIRGKRQWPYRARLEHRHGTRSRIGGNRVRASAALEDGPLQSRTL